MVLFCQLMHFASFLADSLHHSSIKVYLSVVWSLHIDNGLHDPLVNYLQLQWLQWVGATVLFAQWWPFVIFGTMWPMSGAPVLLCGWSSLNLAGVIIHGAGYFTLCRLSWLLLGSQLPDWRGYNSLSLWAVSP